MLGVMVICEWKWEANAFCPDENVTYEPQIEYTPHD